MGEAKGASGINPSPRAGEDDVGGPRSSVRQENGSIPPASGFALFKPLTDWRMSVPTGDGSLLYESVVHVPISYPETMLNLDFL